VKTILKTVVVSVLALVVPSPAVAADEKPIVPVKVQLVLTRYQGDKKVSSLPYTIVVNANGSRAGLRMGASVPIPSTTFGTKEAGSTPLTSYQYRDVGISIDCTAGVLDDGRFRLDVSLEDSSVYGDDVAQSKIAGASSFRTFRLTEQMVLKDGQSREFVAATDKVNGEVTKLEVSLTVVK
jgi:Flp pilus assembly secretin CpaC